jgi:hypothetical protein
LFSNSRTFKACEGLWITHYIQGPHLLDSRWDSRTFPGLSRTFFSIFKDLATGKIFENQLRNTTFEQYIILIEIGENKHLGNNHWAGDNSSIISSLLKKNSRTFKDLIIFQGLSRPGFFLTNSRTNQDFQGPWGPCI